MERAGGIAPLVCFHPSLPTAVSKTAGRGGPSKVVGAEGLAPTQPEGTGFTDRPGSLCSGAHPKWLRGRELNPRERAYETLQRNQHSPRYLEILQYPKTPIDCSPNLR